MNCRTFIPSIRPQKAPRHEAGSTPRHLIPCRYFARGYCSRGDSCLFSHSFNDRAQSQGLQGNHHTTIPFWNSYSSFSPQAYAKCNSEIRRPSVSSIRISPQLIAVPPPSPSSSSITTPDEASPPCFSLQSPDGSTSTPSIIVSDIMKANSTLITRARASVPVSGDTSCDEFSTTRSDVTRDEFLPPPTEVHYAEFYSIPTHSPVYMTPVPYVQRGFGYRDKRARGRESRRRRMRVKPDSIADPDQKRESSGSPAVGVPRGIGCSVTSDSESASMKPHQENWRVIGGGVMLGTPTSATSRRKLKRMQSCARVVEEDDSNDGTHDESFDSNPPTDESFEFSNLVTSVRLSVNQPPLADIIERPKSSLPSTRISPLAAFFTHAEVA